MLKDANNDARSSDMATVNMEGTRILPIDCNGSICKRFIKSAMSYSFKKGF